MYETKYIEPKRNCQKRIRRFFNDTLEENAFILLFRAQRGNCKSVMKVALDSSLQS